MVDHRNADWFEIFLKRSSESFYKSASAFSQQGESLKTVGLVLSGKATALSYSEDGDETWICEYGEGQFIGLTQLLAQNIANFEVRASSDLTVRIITHDRILELMQINAEFCKVISTDLARQLDTSISDFVNMNTLSVKGRICAELLRLSVPIGVDPGRHIIRPSPVFVDLAIRLNSTRETVSRTVSELQNAGILSREPGALIVANPDRLHNAVQNI